MQYVCLFRGTWSNGCVAFIGIPSFNFLICKLSNWLIYFSFKTSRKEHFYQNILIQNWRRISYFFKKPKNDGNNINSNMAISIKLFLLFCPKNIYKKWSVSLARWVLVSSTIICLVITVAVKWCSHLSEATLFLGDFI